MGGIHLNTVKVNDPKQKIERKDFIEEMIIVLRKGKQDHFLVKLIKDKGINLNEKN